MFMCNGILFESFNNTIIYGNSYLVKRLKSKNSEMKKQCKQLKQKLEKFSRGKQLLAELQQSGIFVLTLNLCRLLAETCN